MDWQNFFQPGTSVIALPNWQAPRLFVPAGTIGQRWNGTAFLQAHRRRSRVVRAARRFGAALGLNEKRAVSCERWHLGEFVFPVLPSFAWCAVSVGTAAENQKLTARLFDCESRVLGYVKYASTSAAIRRLHREKHILEQLPAGLGPRLMASGRVGGGEALLIEKVAGRSLSNRPVSSHGLRTFLSRFEQEASFAADDHPGLHFAQYTSSPIHPWLQSLRGRSWPLVFQHGDLTPWNIYASHDAVSAIDWEYGSTLGFPHLDLAYWSLHTAALLDKASPTQATERSIRALTAPWPGLSNSQALAITVLSAFDAWRQALIDGDSPTEPMQRWQRKVWSQPLPGSRAGKSGPRKAQALTGTGARAGNLSRPASALGIAGAR